jgi:hypothetical protein
MNPFLFIVGCPRSGTTLLQRMINAHSQIAVIPETHWIPRLQKEYGEGPVSQELVSNLLVDRRFPKLGIQPWELLQPECKQLSYSDFVTFVFDLYGMKKQKLLAGDKTPGYAREIPLLHRLWPRAKFIHLMRDGRDVCLSVSGWRKFPDLEKRFETWKENPVSTIALWWMWHVRLAREAGKALSPDLYCEAKYENLVSHPEEECARLCKFLGVPYEEQMLRFHEGRYDPHSNRDPKHAWMPVTPGLRDWRLQMDPEKKETFEAQAGELLVELGYERFFKDLPESKMAHASSIQAAFVEHLKSHTGPIPQGW